MRAPASEGTPWEDGRRRYVIVGGTTEPGGLHIHTADLARALDAAGHPVCIISTCRDYFSQLLAGTRVKVVVIPLPERGAGPVLFWRWRTALRRYEGPAGILCRGQGGTTPLPILAALRYSFRDLYAVEHRMPDPRSSGVDPRVRIKDWLACRMIRRSVAVSDAVRTSIIQTFCFQPARIATCHNWVDADRFRPDQADREEIRTRHGIEPDCFLVGYVGRLAPEKRVDLLIRGFAAFRTDSPRPTKLAIVGDGWKAAELRGLAEDLGLKEHIIFAGWVEDASRWHRAFDLAVLPGLLEGLPLTVLETMASGTLCLVHSDGGSVECIEHGRNGFLAALDRPESIAGWISRIARLPEADRAAIKDAARTAVVERFHPRERLALLLEELNARMAADQLRQRGWPSPARSFAFVRTEV
jgi:glycosyltransferase involved in cell wall biosynthesis